VRILKQLGSLWDEGLGRKARRGKHRDTGGTEKRKDEGAKRRGLKTRHYMGRTRRAAVRLRWAGSLDAPAADYCGEFFEVLEEAGELG
jgi:hypothetical protein